jgi:hypothetical protein
MGERAAGVFTGADFYEDIAAKDGDRGFVGFRGPGGAGFIGNRAAAIGVANKAEQAGGSCLWGGRSRSPFMSLVNEFRGINAPSSLSDLVLNS